MYQGALPDILHKTKEDYFSKIIDVLRETADICYDTIKEIPFLACPNKPEGSMFVMVSFSILSAYSFKPLKKYERSITVVLQVKLNVSLLDDISDDLEFCLKLAKEESVVVLPGKKKLFLSIIIFNSRLHLCFG